MLQDAPRDSQVAPKKLLRGLKSSKRASRCVQEVSKSPQKLPRGLPRALKSLPEGPRASNIAAKSFQEASKSPSGSAPMSRASKRTQEDRSRPHTPSARACRWGTRKAHARPRVCSTALAGDLGDPRLGTTAGIAAGIPLLYLEKAPSEVVVDNQTNQGQFGENPSAGQCWRSDFL